MSGQRHINGNELDELLRDLALEENSANVNEAEADLVFGQEYDVMIDKEKERRIIQRLNDGRGGNLWKWFIIPGLILLICGLVWLIWEVKNEERIENKNGKLGEVIENKENEEERHPDHKSADLPVIKIKDTFGHPKLVPIEGYDTVKVEPPGAEKMKESPKERTVPFISEADIIKYRKIKEQMISRLIKGDKDLYTHVPAAKTDYAGKEIIVDGFTMRNVGITNLEYRTFLADLLAQKRNEDYLTAEVKRGNWLKYNYPGFESAYFENEKYNDFPVVNVSYEGAVLFCKWLQDEVDVYVKRYKIKVKDLKVRMPYDEEWIYAAREGYAKIAFEKGYNTIYDQVEGLVDKAFTKRAELVKKRVKRVDTMYTQFTTNHYGWSESELYEFFEKGFKYYPDAPADTIYAERMKVLGKIGRVSEMTGQRNGSKIWLSGLSWNFKEDYQKLENEFRNNLSSPFVGFRIVVINPDDPEYKNPFW